MTMELNCADLESEPPPHPPPPRAPGFQVAGGIEEGQNGKACREAGAHSFSARGQRGMATS